MSTKLKHLKTFSFDYLKLSKGSLPSIDSIGNDGYINSINVASIISKKNTDSIHQNETKIPCRIQELINLKKNLTAGNHNFDYFANALSVINLKRNFQSDRIKSNFTE